MRHKQPASSVSPVRFGIRWLAILVVLLVTASNAEAQKPRKGFVLNLGAGPAQVNHKESFDGQDGPSESNIGVGTDFMIGYAPTDQLLIYYSNDAAFFKPEGADDRGITLVASGLSAIGATYFLQPRSPSLYVNAAVGIGAWNEIDDDANVDGDTGSGLALGGGYEFAPHWLIDLDLILTRPKDDFDYTTKVRTLRLGIIWLLY